MMAGAVAALGFVGSVAHAATQTVNLAFILDSSGSVGSSNFSLAKTALSNAIATVPLADADFEYTVTIVTFSNTVGTSFTQTVTDASDITAIQNAIAGAGFQGSTTNYADAFNALGTLADGDIGIVNMFTDGEPCCLSTSISDATAAAGALQTRGWDSLSFEAIAGADVNYLASIAFDTNGTGAQPILEVGQANLITDPLNESFVLKLGNFGDDYEAAVRAKIQKVVTPEVPLPGGLPLMAGGLLLLGWTKTRRKAV